VRARLVAQQMAEILKQAVYVENRPGAAGGVSHVEAKHAKPDGYTLLMATAGTLAINPHLYNNLSYDALKDFDPVALIAGSPMVLIAPVTSKVGSYKEFAEYVKARPGKVTYGSAGSAAHIAMEMLKAQAGLDLLRVPYKGSPQLFTDLISGQIDFAFEPIGSVIPQLKNGRVKILGVANSTRTPAVPEAPTLSEQGLKDFVAVSWAALLVPKGTPATIVQTLNETVAKVLAEPAILEDFARSGSYPLGGSAAEARRYIFDENARWGKAIKQSGAQAD